MVSGIWWDCQIREWDMNILWLWILACSLLQQAFEFSVRPALRAVCVHVHLRLNLRHLRDPGSYVRGQLPSRWNLLKVVAQSVTISAVDGCSVKQLEFDRLHYAPSHSHHSAMVVVTAELLGLLHHRCVQRCLAQTVTSTEVCSVILASG